MMNFGPQFGLKISGEGRGELLSWVVGGGGRGPPELLPWIRHCESPVVYSHLRFWRLKVKAPKRAIGKREQSRIRNKVIIKKQHSYYSDLCNFLVNFNLHRVLPKVIKSAVCSIRAPGYSSRNCPSDFSTFIAFKLKNSKKFQRVIPSNATVLRCFSLCSYCSYFLCYSPPTRMQAGYAFTF